MKIPIKLIIPALANNFPGFISMDVSGKVFTCFTATGNFSVRPDSDQEIPMAGGQRFGTADGKEFSRLGFYNYTAQPIQIEAAASEDVIIPNQSVSAQINTTVTGKNAPTFPWGTQVNLAAGGGFQVFNGLLAASVRKSFTVFNDHATDPILVRGLNAVNGHKVLAQQGYPMETGSSITLYNPGANPITCYVMEVFYS